MLDEARSRISSRRFNRNHTSIKIPVKKLAIVTSHPIQYHAPLFRLMHQRENISVKVFYSWGLGGMENKYDPGFDKVVEWDIPLLEGYDYEFLHNISQEPGSHHFRGIINPDIVQRIQAWNANAVLVFGWSFCSHLKVMRYFKGKIPVFFRGDSTLLDEPEGFHFKKILRKVYLQWVYRHVDKVFYVGHCNKAYFKKFGIKESQLFFAPHAIDNERFMDKDGSAERSAAVWRNKLCIPSMANVILYAGKFEPLKNPLLLLNAFKELQYPNLHLVMIGNGVLEKELKQNADKIPNIHFLDFQNQQLMPVIHRIGDVFVLPSNSETWGLSVNEAMASGRPVIVSDKCGCAANLIHSGKNGYVFKAGDMNDLICCIRKCLQNDLPSMGRYAWEVIQTFHFHRIAEVLENTLLENS